ncbi:MULTISPECIES: ABC transporter ATP-binding protein [unclassified Pseudodesulfovibrio]|uniref:ABC transporter ATP-binding protein n=1 Tax=unclassified Pseudodesulfovibrio TaxID=2661612 RepID=UPI000FEB77DE|nr:MULTISPECIES: ABC transporter ATP-binding protein [unclassified Pseudodesulfovibrio]MCJ2164312.1 ABC transporter ATP-binding protein [Pseudodesulfovibrio sp. S3-i]RWU04523.1 ABC transporter ATP-binding protein [Pseudodesulfovibrio sp. S3]
MGEVVIKGVERSFGDTVACSGIDLDIAKGEFFTFLGPSGCGKTTILRLIAGFITPQSGSIFLGGRDITRLAPEKRKVGMVFQNYALFPYMTVHENIEYGLKIQKKSPEEIRGSVARHMDMVGLTGFGQRRISELSGGEQQRVALARSLAVEPRVLLLDEPMSNLDARLRDRMRVELKNLQRKLGITTVFVTHDQTEALTLSDRIAVFDKGRIVQVGTPEEIYGKPKNAFVAKFIGDTNLLETRWKDGRATVADGLDIQVNGQYGKGKYLSIRPQDISLTKEPAASANCLEGRLADRQLNGVWINYVVQVKDITLRVAALNTMGRNIDCREGNTVFASFPEQCVTVLDE